MLELITGDVLALLAVSFGVGIVVGLTGMGGGALMTPALIFLGIPPTTAVANDLVAAAANKSIGAAVHWRRGSPHLGIALWLTAGSVPAAFAGAFIIRAVGGGEDREQFVKLAIGCALLLAAAGYVVRVYLALRARTSGAAPVGSGEPPPRPLATVLVGAGAGLLVGLTSVGSGSLIIVAMLMLYPTLSALRLVGTDLVQAIPLVTAAALGHVLVNGVVSAVLIPLMVGGMPGTYVGARLAAIVAPGVIRKGIAIVLTLTGLALLGVPSTAVGFIGAGLLILGPLLWGLARHLHGEPAFLRTPSRQRSGSVR